MSRKPAGSIVHHGMVGLSAGLRQEAPQNLPAARITPAGGFEGKRKKTKGKKQILNRGSTRILADQNQKQISNGLEDPR